MLAGAFRKVKMLVVTEELSIPLREFQFTFSRSSGPGGQNVNKVNTKVTLRWSVRESPSLTEDLRQRFLSTYARRITVGGELVLTSQRFRDQGRNVADCLSKLRVLLAEVAQPAEVRRATSVPRRSKRKRLADKRYQSEKKRRRRGPVDE